MTYPISGPSDQGEERSGSPSHRGSEMPIGHPGFREWLEEHLPRCLAHAEESRKLAGDSWGAGYDCGYADALAHALDQFAASGLMDDRSSVDASDAGAVKQSAAHSGERAGEPRTVTEEDREYASELLADLANGDEPRHVVAAQWFRKARVENSLRRATPPSQPAMKALEEELQKWIETANIAGGVIRDLKMQKEIDRARKALEDCTQSSAKREGE